jgi:hypothetical protein
MKQKDTNIGVYNMSDAVHAKPLNIELCLIFVIFSHYK